MRYNNHSCAEVAELVDAHGLEPCGLNPRGGSIPLFGTFCYDPAYGHSQHFNFCTPSQHSFSVTSFGSFRNAPYFLPRRFIHCLDYQLGKNSTFEWS